MTKFHPSRSLTWKLTVGVESVSLNPPRANVLQRGTALRYQQASEACEDRRSLLKETRNVQFKVLPKYGIEATEKGTSIMAAWIGSVQQGIRDIEEKVALSMHLSRVLYISKLPLVKSKDPPMMILGEVFMRHFLSIYRRGQMKGDSWVGLAPAKADSETEALLQRGSYAAVWIGNSSDMAHYVHRRFGPRSVAMLFMDHRGSLFHEDLESFQELDLLKDGAIVVADNVLKPGAPYFLWQICHSPCFEARLLAVPEFGLGHQVLQDWMALGRYEATATTTTSPAEGPLFPAEIHALANDCDQLRRRSLTGQLTSEDWAAHAGQMEQKLAELGISATVADDGETAGLFAAKKERQSDILDRSWGNEAVRKWGQHGIQNFGHRQMPDQYFRDGTQENREQAMKKEKRKAKHMGLEDWQMR
eukprot:s52_g5.t1